MAEHDVSVSLGSYLRALREARQGSLEEMARSTRVSVHQLEALECGSFAELPAPVFVKGFIRAYCHFLGESPDEALGRYRDLLGQRPAPEARPPAPRSAPAWSGSPIFISLVLLVVFLGFRRGSKPAVPDLAPGAKVEAPSPAAIPPAPGATSAPPVASADATAGGPTAQRLLVKALEATWIRIQPDHRGAVEERLAPGATREWTAEKRFLLTVGNAGGIEIELNGRPMPPLGARGAVIRQLELPRAAAAGS